ncbi:MAG TPA: NUDIX hydrolase [Pyrinomonadaceae bacterium]|nr:NUDIX hydrolase [Pyrinomonadaceae bacterium]
MSDFVTKKQVSAGGVVFRRQRKKVEVALISVGEEGRWQLPKGLVGRGESPEEAALREVREETGLACEIVAPIETIEYWYFSKGRGARVRFHKNVHFFLMRYRSGDTDDHDDEVNEARWFPLEEVAGVLAFKGERNVLELAREMI